MFTTHCAPLIRCSRISDWWCLSPWRGSASWCASVRRRRCRSRSQGDRGWRRRGRLREGEKKLTMMIRSNEYTILFTKNDVSLFSLFFLPFYFNCECWGSIPSFIYSAYLNFNPREIPKAPITLTYKNPIMQPLKLHGPGWRHSFLPKGLQLFFGNSSGPISESGIPNK